MRTDELMEKNQMKLAKSIAVVAVCALSYGALSGCTPVSKIRRTLALSDIHIQAGVAESRGQDETALELWTEYVNRRPQSVLGEYRLGMVETRLGLYNQAAGHLRIAYDLTPGNLEHLDALSQALLLGNQTESLMKLLRQTMDEGKPGTGHLRLAHYAQQAGQMDEAREALILAIAQDQGESIAPYIAMADFSASIGDTVTEIEHLRMALWFDASDPEILARLESKGMIAGPSLVIDPR